MPKPPLLADPPDFCDRTIAVLSSRKRIVMPEESNNTPARGSCGNDGGGAQSRGMPFARRCFDLPNMTERALAACKAPVITAASRAS